MADIKFTNFARATLAIGAASGATSLTLASGKGALFPSLGAGEYFYLTLENSSLVREIVKVTARATDVLTVVRAQDNTTAQTWNAGDVASLRFNAKAIEESVAGALLAVSNLSDVANPATALSNLGAQPYDADTAKTDVAQTFTATQRGAITTDNDASLNLSAGNNFSVTPSASVVLTFTNIASSPGQSGLIKFINGGNYAISAHANTKISAANLSVISATGTYLMTYFCDGTDVFVVASGSFV